MVNVFRLQYNKFIVWSGGRGLGNLFTAVANHVATSPSARGDMICHSHEQVSKAWGDMIRHSHEQVSKSPAT